jgi:hypothetical protein
LLSTAYIMGMLTEVSVQKAEGKANTADRMVPKSNTEEGGFLAQLKNTMKNREVEVKNQDSMERTEPEDGFLAHQGVKPFWERSVPVKKEEGTNPKESVEEEHPVFSHIHGGNAFILEKTQADLGQEGPSLDADISQENLGHEWVKRPNASFLGNKEEDTPKGEAWIGSLETNRSMGKNDMVLDLPEADLKVDSKVDLGVFEIKTHASKILEENLSLSQQEAFKSIEVPKTAEFLEGAIEESSVAFSEEKEWMGKEDFEGTAHSQEMKDMTLVEEGLEGDLKEEAIESAKTIPRGDFKELHTMKNLQNIASPNPKEEAFGPKEEQSLLGTPVPKNGEVSRENFSWKRETLEMEPSKEIGFQSGQKTDFIPQGFSNDLGAENRNDGSGLFSSILEENVPDASSIDNSHHGPEILKETILEQWIQKAKMTLDGAKSEMELELSPEHLGKLSMKLVTEEGKLTAKILTENPGVKQVLENNVSILKDSLEQVGVKVESFTVDVGSQNREDRKEKTFQSEKQKKETKRVFEYGLSTKMSMISAGYVFDSSTIRGYYESSMGSMNLTA